MKTSQNFFFKKKNDLIFRFDDIITDDHVYESRRLCISHSIIQNILRLIHDDDYDKYVKCFEKISISYYIRNLSRYFRDYLKHCSKCQIYQTRRYSSYDFLQLIFTSPIFFHIIAMNFILTLSKFFADFDIVMSISCKFFKRVIFIVDCVIWFVAQWKKALFDRLNVADWELLKAIIFDRDKMFLFELWMIVFKKLDIQLLYSTAYHVQIDDLFEKMNQWAEIALRFYLFTMNDFVNWLDVFFKMQRHFNNVVFTISFKTSNEAAYEFTSVQSLSLWKTSAIVENLVADLRKFFVADARKFFAETFFFVATRTKIEIADAIAFEQMNVKYYYDQRHQPLYMKVENYAYIRFHHEYDISFIEILKKKIN